MVVVSSVVDYQFIARPNCSLSPKGRVLVVAAAAALSLIVATGFSLIGAWLVFPFAGLEVVAVAYAFYYISCHSEDYESITIEGDHLAVEKRNYKKTSQIVFHRYWARVLLRDTPNGDQSLLLRSHGKEVEFGRYLMSNEQRLALAQQLKRRVGAVF
ncbi:MAG TPA: DUF2244 domain-containing protein [Methylophilaceae bacterium]|nr:DUF2244 domain-containing protein [Methylophilaceae bacterium]